MTGRRLAGLAGVDACRAGMITYSRMPEIENQSAYVASARRLTLAGARKMMETAIRLAERSAFRSRWRLPMQADISCCSSAWTAAASTPCIRRRPRPCARRPTSGRRLRKGAQGQALDTSHAIGLALAAGPERWTAMEGGYPIIVDGECIGGIGVSGGNWEFDDRVAREAVEAIGATYKIDVMK